MAPTLLDLFRRRKLRSAQSYERYAWSDAKTIYRLNEDTQFESSLFKRTYCPDRSVISQAIKGCPSGCSNSAVARLKTTRTRPPAISERRQAARVPVAYSIA